MEIINKNLIFRQEFMPRQKTNKIIVHHTACSRATVEDIHRWHKVDNGWNGIGYHAYINKEGKVYAGRPFGTVGAHCLGENDDSIGVCFEGNFDKEKMGEVQNETGVQMLKWLKALYPEAVIKKHKDFNQTSCPGSNFPENIIKMESLKNDTKIEPKNDNEFSEALNFFKEHDIPTEYKALVLAVYKLVKNGLRK